MPILRDNASVVTPETAIRPAGQFGVGAYRGWWWFYGSHSEEACCA
jgi:hypothetical protein